jgi:hypothetical protein
LIGGRICKPRKMPALRMTGRPMPAANIPGFLMADRSRRAESDQQIEKMTA